VFRNARGALVHQAGEFLSDCHSGLKSLDLLEHRLDARSGRVVVASRIVGALRHTFNLDDAIHHVQGEALATKGPEHAHRPGVGHGHAEGLGELATRVRQESDHASLDALVRRPRAHHRSVVDAVHKYLVDPSCLESILMLKVTWDLRARSGWGEGTWQADDDRLFACGASHHVDLLWGEPKVD